MRQEEDVEARLSRPPSLKTFREHNFAEGANGQAGEGNAELNARHDAVEVAEQAFDHASAGAAFGHELTRFSKNLKKYDQSQRAYKEVRTHNGRGSHLVRGGERPDRGLSWPERRGQDHHDAHVDVFPASHVGGGVGGGLRRARATDGGEKAHRLFARNSAAVS